MSIITPGTGRALLLGFYCFLSALAPAAAQPLLQQIQGSVVDRDSRQPLAGASVRVIEGGSGQATGTDTAGRFILRDIPVGRVRLQCSYVGYREYTTDYILINTAKVPDLTIELEDAPLAQEGIVVSATRNPKGAVNRFVQLSGRSFSAEETQRFAASANDPSRMVLGFPGVQATRDARSDIIIRGNNPSAMQWRLEGVDIVNPNHFARKGSSGGGITIFSLSMLDNSDFLTGAMPAEYGDALSGVFDMHFRKGNNQEREYTVKAGMIGLDFSTEGPIRKGRSSYLLNYRYSTLGLLSALGLNLVSERETNTFQDLSFNLAFSNKTGKVQWNFWGIGGASRETFKAVKDTADWRQYDDYAVYDFRTRMGAAGIGNTWKWSDKSFLTSSLVVIGQRVTFVDDTLNRARVPFTVNDERYDNNRITLATAVNHKFSAKVSGKAGLYLSDIFYAFRQDALDFTSGNYRNVTDGSGSTFLVQPYAQFSLKPGARWTVNPGIHVMHLTLNGKTVADPRLSVKFRINGNQSVSLAYGLHSKTLPLGFYFYRDPVTGGLPNQDLDMLRAHHYILAYDHLFPKSWRLHTELYHQQLFHVPVSANPASTYSMLNQIDGYAAETLVSKGTGNNTGVDISVERFFSRGFFMIAAFSVYRSTYEPLNGITYNTRFNAGTSGSWTGAREWQLRKNKVFQAGWKMVYNGGFRLTPLSTANASTREPVEDQTRPFTEQVSPYFRTDGRLSLRKDKAGQSWQLALDIQNVFGIKNEDGLSRRYDPAANRWVYKTQSGIVPVLSFQIDF